MDLRNVTNFLEILTKNIWFLEGKKRPRDITCSAWFIHFKEWFDLYSGVIKEKVSYEMMY